MRRVVARFSFLCNLIGNRPQSLTGLTANVNDYKLNTIFLDNLKYHKRAACGICSKASVKATSMEPIILLSLTFFIWPATKLYSQDLEFKRNSIRTGIGIGYNEGKRETGIGLIYSIGLQKSYGNQN